MSGAERETKLLPEHIQHLIAQRDQQLAFATSTRIAARRIHRETLHDSLKEACGKISDRARLRDLAKRGVCEQHVIAYGMCLSSCGKSVPWPPQKSRKLARSLLLT